MSNLQTLFVRSTLLLVNLFQFLAETRAAMILFARFCPLHRMVDIQEVAVELLMWSESGSCHDDRVAVVMHKFVPLWDAVVQEKHALSLTFR